MTAWVKRGHLYSPASAMMLSGIPGGGGGPPPPSDPSAILTTDLLVWYKKATGIYDAVSGGSLVSSNGTEIGRWEDQSGNAYHATRANGNVAVGHLQWSMTTTDRGAGTVAMTGDTAAYLALPDAVGSALSSAGQGQIWIRIKKVTAADGSGLCDFGSDTSGNHYVYTDTNWYDGFGSTARKTCGAPSFDISSAFHVASMWSATNDYAAKINNGADFSFTTATNTVGFRTSNVRIGLSSGVYGMTGFMSEVVIAKIKASGTQCTDMQTYLST